MSTVEDQILADAEALQLGDVPSDPPGGGGVEGTRDKTVAQADKPKRARKPKMETSGQEVGLTPPGGTIHQRMIAIIGALPAIGKTQRNTQQGFMFRGQDDMLNALNPKLAEHGVFIIPDVIERVVAQRQTAKGSIMFEVNLHVRFTAYGADGDSVTGSAWGEGTDMGDKATSKAMTMAFKYWLTQAFAISTADAPDPDRGAAEESTGRGGQPPTPPAPPATNGRSEQDEKNFKAIKAIQRKLEAAGLSEERFREQIAASYGGVMHVSELTPEQRADLVKRLRDAEKKLEQGAPA